MANPERTAEIPIKMNRASVGDAEYTFAVLQGEDPIGTMVLLVPREKIVIDEQKLTGRTFTGRLTVDVIEEEEDRLLVETVDEGNKRQFWIDKETGKVLVIDDPEEFYY